MAGGLIQLVAYGIQDLYLTGEPQITFFKVLYRRYTNFSIESIMQFFSTPPDFGEKVSCTISRAGDLVGKVFLFVELPAIPKFVNLETGEEDPFKKIAWVRGIGHAIIDETTVEIGGKLIDRQYGEWLYIWEQLSNRQDYGLDKLVGNVPEIYEFSNGKRAYQLYVPLKFWFCKNIGLALPLVALASTDVKITFTFRRLDECIRIGPTHSIEILEDIVPFQPGDYIEQVVDCQMIRGYVIDFDYLNKRLYYIKIVSPTAVKRIFQSACDSTLSATVLNQTSCPINIPFRIYRSLNPCPINQLDLMGETVPAYCTPKPNAKECIETICLPCSCRPRIIRSFLYVDYVYLDTDERLKFIRNTHEYLIEQVQKNKIIGVNSKNVQLNMALNHPCKSHYWIAQLDSLVGPGTINDLFNYTDSPVRFCCGKLAGTSLVRKSLLTLNSEQRLSWRGNKYFGEVTPWQFHYRGPEPGINMYSFGLYPEDFQPSGTCEMSRIDDIRMFFKLSDIINQQNTCRIRTYTLNYNFLRVAFNLGGVVFDV